MNEATAKVIEVIDQLQNIVKDNATDAVNLGLSAVRLDGINNILLTLCCLVVSSVGLFIGYKFYKNLCSAVNKTEKEEKCYRKDFSDFPLLFAPMISLFIIFGLFFIVSLFILFDVWNWVAIFQPKLYVAHHILAKVVK